MMAVVEPGGLWIRIKHRFGPRWMEWVLAWITMSWGGVLLLPAENFNGQSWAFFSSQGFTETGLGMTVFFLGIAHLGALIVNGARREITPWIRVISSGLSFMLWILLLTGFVLSGHIGEWLAYLPAFAFAEIVNVIRAGRDVGDIGHEH